MNNYIIPTDNAFVEEVAMAIARERLLTEASDTIFNLMGHRLKDSDILEEKVDLIFKELWNGMSDHDMKQKESYRRDAIAAIRIINLKLLTF